jgi:predicted Fe-Mo cluster-binding NifX family protein
MKIAAVSEDGVTISQHFGRAPLYVVVTVDDGVVTAHETRDKLGHAHFAGEHGEHSHGHGQQGHAPDKQGHGYDPASQSRHTRMIEAIRDCEVLLAGGMGGGAHYSLEQAGIRPVVTDMTDIDEAALAAFRGEITDHVERLH